MKTLETILISIFFGMVFGRYSEKIEFHLTSDIFYTITGALCAIALPVSVFGLIWGWFP
jgi:hypothetical protein